MVKGEITALFDWGIGQGLDKETCIRLCLRALQASMTEAKRKIEWWEKQRVMAEEEMTAIEESAGIEAPPEEPHGKSFNQYVEGASDA